MNGTKLLHLECAGYFNRDGFCKISSNENLKQRLKQTIIAVEKQKKANQWLMNTMRGDHFGVKRAPDPAEQVKENWEDDEDLDGVRFNYNVDFKMDFQGSQAWS